MCRVDAALLLRTTEEFHMFVWKGYRNYHALARRRRARDQSHQDNF